MPRPLSGCAIDNINRPDYSFGESIVIRRECQRYINGYINGLGAFERGSTQCSVAIQSRSIQCRRFSVE